MHSNPFPFVSIIALLSLLAIHTQAQEQEQRWYQVELLIFSQPEADTGEQWDALPQLAYPGTARFLIYPNRWRRVGRNTRGSVN